MPSLPMGIRTEPPSFTESKEHEHMKSSFSISSELSSKLNKERVFISNVSAMLLPKVDFKKIK